MSASQCLQFSKKVHQCQWWITTCHNPMLLPTFSVTDITNSSALNLIKLKSHFSFFGDTNANQTLREQWVFLRVPLPKATISKWALCSAPMRTCTLPTTLQALTELLPLPSRHFRAGISSALLHHSEQQAGARAAVSITRWKIPENLEDFFCLFSLLKHMFTTSGLWSSLWD